MLGLSVDLHCNPETVKTLEEKKDDAKAIQQLIESKLEYLSTSRPTAVNLFNAIDEIKQIIQVTVDKYVQESIAGTNSMSAKEQLCQVIKQHTEFMLDRDVQDNKNIGKYGAQIILKKKKDNQKVTIMTICNTGSLATAGYGTALGVVRTLEEQNRLQSIIACETRPYNQGSRLTAFEIVEENMSGGILICDSAAAATMKTKNVDAVVVGADRVCRNGDTANKIGTYNLAVVAAAHGVPFYVAAPFTTLDVNLPNGDGITIEERHKDELIDSAKAPKNIDCWNPAFDVTPARLIAGIITEKGVIEPAINGTIDVAAFVETQTAVQDINMNGPEKLLVPFDYKEQNCDSIPDYLNKYAPEVMKILGAEDPADISAIEMGDGNLNLVFIVSNLKQHSKQVIVKQALPYVRSKGESWPLSLDRAYFEYKALLAEKESCPEFVPDIYYFNKADGLIVMQYIAPPNIVLRKGLIQGIRYPTVASDLGIFCAKTLFKTSGFRLSPAALRQNVSTCSLVISETDRGNYRRTRKI